MSHYPANNAGAQSCCSGALWYEESRAGGWPSVLILLSSALTQIANSIARLSPDNGRRDAERRVGRFPSPVIAKRLMAS